MTQPLTQGIHHLGLAVLNADETAQFFCSQLGWREVGRNPAYPSVFVTDDTLTLTLWQVADPQTATRFDRRANVGLHHLALKVADLDTLQALYERISQLPDVSPEFAPQPSRPGSPNSHFICAIPGGLRVEFVAPNAP